MSARRPVDPEQQTRAMYVRRLGALIRKRKLYSNDLNPLGVRMLDRAIDATYRDCIDYGAADEARPIMAEHRRRHWKKGTT